MRHWRILMLAVSLTPMGLAPALAGPNGATVVGGSATVQGQGTASVIVNQTSQNAIINWNTFNIGAGETTTITMPSASSTELDRVTGGQGPSQILGTLTSNGQVFLVNPDGILFGKSAQVNVGSFLATTHDIANSDFMAGRFNFFGLGNPAASIVNQGTITAQSGGFAALVAPGVRNTGTITATLGQIGLASANSFALDFYGDRLIQLNLGDAIASQVIDVSSRKALSSLVSNEGTLKANGGRVELTAVAARQVVDSVINNTGVIEANTIGTHNGMIVLEAATAANKPAGTPTQTVKVSGTLSAAGKQKGTTGGTILVTGENVQLSGATLNASGQAGGGAVLVGGDWGGGNPNKSLVSNASAYLEPYAVPNASTVSVDAATTINASATSAGNGGKVIVWSNEATTFYGTIFAQGGPLSGSGGFVETSGHQLSADGSVNTSAPNGATGTWLIDPLNATIATNPGSEVITVSSIESALQSGNVVVTTVGTTGSEPGDITVAASLSWANANTLTLNAYRDININSGVTISNTGAGNLVLRADATGTGVGTVSFLGSGKVDFSQSTGTVSIFYNPADNPAGSVVNSTSYTTPFNYSPYVLTNSAVPGQLTAYMLVNTVYDLQNIQNNLASNYALGTNIDASATASWNGGAGFVPIGNSSSPFTGSLNGQHFAVTGLTINSVSAPYVGLFGYVGSSGSVTNLGLTNASIFGTFGGSAASVGGLVGYNAGTISQTYVTGTVSTDWTQGVVGGLVGTNTGTIFQSYSLASVSGANAGGFVGQIVGGSISQAYAAGKVTSQNLTLVASVPEGNGPNAFTTGVYVSGNYAYVADYGGGLRIFNISNPNNPILVGTSTAINDAYNVIVSGQYAYVRGAAEVAIFNVSNPANPTLSGTFSLNGSSNTGTIALAGNYLVVPDEFNAVVRILNISNPANIVQVGSYTQSGGFSYNNPLSVAVQGNYAYIGDGGLGSNFYILNISNPANPTLVGSVPYSRIVPNGISISGNYAYVAANQGLYVYNISNPANPVEIGTPVPGDFNAVKVAGNYAYVANTGANETQVFNVGNPTAVSSVGLISAGAWDLAVSGNYVFVADNPGFALGQQRIGLSVVSTMGSNSGGLAWSSSGSVTSSYWDQQATGQSSSAAGILQASLVGVLPTGFDRSVWGSNSNINNGYPYLLWQAASNSPPQSPTIFQPSLTTTLDYVASPVTRTYGSPNPPLSGTVVGFVNGDTLASATTGTLTFSTTATPSSNVGTYPITGSGLTATSSNYIFAQAPGNATALTITPAPLSITANDFTIVQGQPLPKFTASYSGFVLGQAPSIVSGLTFSTTDKSTAVPGEYLIMPGGATAANYALTFVDGNLFVVPVTTPNRALNNAATFGQTVESQIGGFLWAFASSVVSTSENTILSWLPKGAASNERTSNKAQESNIPVQATQVALSQLLPDVVGLELDAADVTLALSQALQRAHRSSVQTIDNWLGGRCQVQPCTKSMSEIKSDADLLSQSSDFVFGLINLQSIPQLSGMNRNQYIESLLILQAEHDGYLVTP